MTDHQAEQGGPVQGDAASDGSAALARALREMTEQHRRLEMIIDGTAMGTWEWNCQTGQMWVNERWAQIVGYTREELAPITPETFFRLVHPEDLARSNALLREHLEGRSPQYDSLCRMRHKQGHWIWVQDRGRVYEWDAHGQPLRMAGAHADVSDLQNGTRWKTRPTCASACRRWSTPPTKWRSLPPIRPGSSTCSTRVRKNCWGSAQTR